jgi:hypothetical protein
VAQYDLGVIFTTDEETTGGIDGAGQLAARGWGGQVMVNADAIADWHIESGAKGIMRYRVHSQGVAGHASRPWEYRNAITQLMRYLDEIATHFPAEPCDDPAHAHNTFSIGTIHGGQIVNQVAGEASAGIDLRVMPGRTLAEMVELLEDVAARHPHITLEALATDTPISLDPNHPEAQRLRRIIHSVTGAEPGFVLSHGGFGKPTLRPPRPNRPHVWSARWWPSLRRRMGRRGRRRAICPYHPRLPRRNRPRFGIIKRFGPPARVPRHPAPKHGLPGPNPGTLAEWLRRGLQNLVHRFEPGRCLQQLFPYYYARPCIS